MIDERAIVHESAEIHPSVTVGPWTTIGQDVVIGENTQVGPHVVINGRTHIGANNKIFQFSSIGEDPQDVKYAGEDTLLDIGDNNVIREFCTIHRGTTQGGGVTRIGHHNLLMAYVHIAHDCILGNRAIFSNNAALAGHVVVSDYAIISAFSGVHQFCSIGAHAFVAKSSIITKDVLPFTLVDGNPPKAYGLNSVGLKRRGFSAETLSVLKEAYRVIFRSGLTVAKALDELLVLAEKEPEVQVMIDALRDSTRGIVR